MTRYGGAGPRRLGRWSGEQIAESPTRPRAPARPTASRSWTACLRHCNHRQHRPDRPDRPTAWIFRPFRRTVTSDGWGIHLADRPTTREATHRRRSIAVGRFGRSYRQLVGGSLAEVALMGGRLVVTVPVGRSGRPLSRGACATAFVSLVTCSRPFRSSLTPRSDKYGQTTCGFLFRAGSRRAAAGTSPGRPGCRHGWTRARVG